MFLLTFTTLVASMSASSSTSASSKKSPPIPRVGSPKKSSLHGGSGEHMDLQTTRMWAMQQRKLGDALQQKRCFATYLFGDFLGCGNLSLVFGDRRGLEMFLSHVVRLGHIEP